MLAGAWAGSGNRVARACLKFSRQKRVDILATLLQLYIRKHVLSAHLADGIAAELNANFVCCGTAVQIAGWSWKDFHTQVRVLQNESLSCRGMEVAAGTVPPYFAEATLLTADSVRQDVQISNDDVFLAGRSNPKQFGPPFALLRW